MKNYVPNLTCSQCGKPVNRAYMGVCSKPECGAPVCLDCRGGLRSTYWECPKHKEAVQTYINKIPQQDVNNIRTSSVDDTYIDYLFARIFRTAQTEPIDNSSEPIGINPELIETAEDAGLGLASYMLDNGNLEFVDGKLSGDSEQKLRDMFKSLIEKAIS
jgi:hypothetical protein